jgi:hypothetical protein
MSLQVQCMGSSNLSYALMVHNVLQVSVWMIAHGMVWSDAVWRGWMTARVCSGRLFKRGRGETV